MSEPALHRHGLEPFLESVPQKTGGDVGVTIQIQPGLGHINIRGAAEDAEFIKAATKVLGQELPGIANTLTLGDHRVYWLGPDEFLVVTSMKDTHGLLEQFRRALAGQQASITDLSGGQVALRINGPGARDVLTKGCTLDFHPAEFGAGACAQSGLAKANVIIGHIDENQGFEIVVRRSFEEYLVSWLQQAAAEFNVEFSVI